MPVIRIQRRVQAVTGWSELALAPFAWRRGIGRRVATVCGGDPEAYERRLNQDPEEMSRLVEGLLNKETWFFRNSNLFDWLRQELARMWVEAPPQKLRLLSAPCATGEEAYSLVVVALEAGIPLEYIDVVGVDISEAALKRARQACYGPNAFRSVPASFQTSYFAQEKDQWRLHPKITAAVSWTRMNLTDPDEWTELGRFHVILCRHLLIYLTEAIGAQVANSCVAHLYPEGVLALAPCEVVGWASSMAMPLKVPRCGLFRRRQPSRIAAPPPPLPPWLESRKQRPSPRALSSSRRRRYVPRLEESAPPAPAPSVCADLDGVIRLSDEGKLSEAYEAWERLMDQGSPTAQILYVGALLQDSIGQAARAERLLRQALYLEPDHDEALLYMAALAESNQRLDGAEKLRARARRAANRRSDKGGNG